MRWANGEAYSAVVSAVSRTRSHTRGGAVRWIASRNQNRRRRGRPGERGQGVREVAEQGHSGRVGDAHRRGEGLRAGQAMAVLVKSSG
jgi:hypothetical protein